MKYLESALIILVLCLALSSCHLSYSYSQVRLLEAQRATTQGVCK